MRTQPSRAGVLSVLLSVLSELQPRPLPISCGTTDRIPGLLNSKSIEGDVLRISEVIEET